MRAQVAFDESKYVNDFTTLGIADPLADALKQAGYTSPTPIQMQTIPMAIAGDDVLGIAQTGTGKTAAFALPILQHLLNNPIGRRKLSARALVLAPTRELASQIAKSFRAYSNRMKVSISTVFGGVPISRQERQLFPGVDILVATPGRLIDLMQREAILLDRVEMLVVDEADQMLDMGFIHSLRQIASALPRKRQTLFFSATMPPAIGELASRFLTNPSKVEVSPSATPVQRISQYATFVNQSEKQALLTLTLRDPSFAKAVVFTRTKHGADRVVRHLEGAGVPAVSIHGNKSQSQREQALAAFSSDRVGVLVATDIAARGIDIDSVSHVINYELPNVPEQYVHRIGRTARAGREGVALSFCAPDEKAYLKQIERLTGQKLQAMPLPADFLAQAAKLPPPAPRVVSRGGGGGRGGPGAQRGPSRRGGRPATNAARPGGSGRPGFRHRGGKQGEKQD